MITIVASTGTAQGAVHLGHSGPNVGSRVEEHAGAELARWRSDDRPTLGDTRAPRPADPTLLWGSSMDRQHFDDTQDDQPDPACSGGETKVDRTYYPPVH